MTASVTGEINAEEYVKELEGRMQEHAAYGNDE